MSGSRWRLRLAYDGGPFAGWQSQAGGRAVQDMVEAALADLCGTRVRVQGAGRTDAGVHALGQVAHFDAPGSMAALQPQRWRDALNVRLPATIRVLDACPVAAEFHARFSACGKHYRYRIGFGPVLPPFEPGHCWHRRYPLDASHLRWLASWLHGRHDFRRLAANRRRGSEPASTVRSLWRLQVREPADGVMEFHIEGNGFLYRMVRMIVGSLVAVVEGRRDEGWLIDLLRRPDAPDKSPHCAPAAGLCLMQVHYPQ